MKPCMNGGHFRRRTNMIGPGRPALQVSLLAGVDALSAAALSGQAPLPPRGQQGQVPQDQRGGGPPAASNLPANPIVSPLATISDEITGPGKMFAALFSLNEIDLTKYNYDMKEYFVSGT